MCYTCVLATAMSSGVFGVFFKSFPEKDMVIGQHLL